MRILHGNTSIIRGGRPLPANTAGRAVRAGNAVTGIAVLDTQCDALRLESSRDGFVTTDIDLDLGEVSGNLLLPLPAPVTSQAWRLRAISSGSVGMLVVGSLITIRAPSYPWSFEVTQRADDRTSLGGATWSRLRYARREGVWSFNRVRDSEIDLWRSWYASTQGFRRPFIVEDPLRPEIYLVKAPGDFPLTLSDHDKYTGQIQVEEVLRG